MVSDFLNLRDSYKLNNHQRNHRGGKSKALRTLLETAQSYEAKVIILRRKNSHSNLSLIGNRVSTVAILSNNKSLSESELNHTPRCLGRLVGKNLAAIASLSIVQMRTLITIFSPCNKIVLQESSLPNLNQMTRLNYTLGAKKTKLMTTTSKDSKIQPRKRLKA